MRQILSLSLPALCAFALAACGGGAGPEVSRAVCVLKPTAGSAVQGSVEFVQEGAGVRIRATLTGLAPGAHGFHIHEWGDCDCSDGKCTGGHFNPAGAAHAGRDAKVRHVGDLGNIQAAADGKGTLDFVDTMVKLTGANSVIGRAITVHADADDNTSQPTGNAGARVAVGVIGIAPPK
ncbi:MAG TPA: superoxide dismutase family protein [Planctomycetota bacterium]